MAKIDIFPNQNNSNDIITFEDNDYEKKRMKEILDRASSTALDPQAVKMARVNSKFSHY